MKTIKFILVLVALIFALGSISAFAINNPDNKANNATLNLQLGKELKSLLSQTAYLSLTGKNLKGTAEVKLIVFNNGKIDLLSVESNNKYLKEHIISRVKETNYWTSKSFAGTVMTYKIKSK
ncbi:MAG: hypothetical protein ACP5P3_09460 [Ignavibacteria bacterium]